VSHRLHEVKQIADRITVMRDGAVVAEGAAATFGEHDLVRAMVGRSVSMLARKASRATGEIALRVRSLSRAGEFSDAALELRAGEVVGMAGLIGSGRSELAQAVIGYAKPTSGTVEVGGVRLRGRGVRGALKAGVGYVPEERVSQGLFLPLTVRENIALPAI